MDVRTAHTDDRIAAAPKGPLSSLSSETATRALAASCDIALVIDRDGIIRDVATGGGDMAGQGVEDWLNRPWSETVRTENHNKIDELLAGKGEPGRWRQVNHDSPDGDLPIRYLAIPSGSDGSIVAIGRDMRSGV